MFERFLEQIFEHLFEQIFEHLFEQIFEHMFEQNGLIMTAWFDCVKRSCL